MDTNSILSSLRAERERIDRAIAAVEALEAPVASSGRGRRAKASVAAAPKQKGRRGPMTAAGRKRLSEMMKKRWAERKKKAKTV